NAARHRHREDRRLLIGHLAPVRRDGGHDDRRPRRRDWHGHDQDRRAGARRAGREVQPAARHRSRARGRRLLRAGVDPAMKPASRAVHSGREIKARTPLAPPITPAAVHVYEDLDDYEAVASGERQGYFYGRNSNENRSMLEAAVADLEGAEAAVSSASGMAALHMAILALTPRPTTIVATRELYGGTMALLRQDLEPSGYEPGIVAGDAKTIAAARSRSVRMGGTLGAFDAWLALRGLRTLEVRMRRHSENSIALAKAMRDMPGVAVVHHPLLEGSPSYEVARRLLPEGA